MSRDYTTTDYMIVAAMYAVALGVGILLVWWANRLPKWARNIPTPRELERRQAKIHATIAACDHHLTLHWTGDMHCSQCPYHCDPDTGRRTDTFTTDLLEGAPWR